MEGEETKEATAVPQSAGVKQGEASKQEALVEKYKRLLSLARSSLEANQAALAQKDTQIAELTRNLEERRAQALRLSRNDDGLEAASIPRSLLRRVDVDDVIWILVEYDDGTSEDGWVCFHSETELNEYIQRVQGVPLVAPHRCLTAAESNKIETEAQAKVDVIVEEFRRFKLRTDIARKQKDAEARQALLRSTSAPGTGTPSSSSSSGNGNSKGDAGGDEESNSDKWRSAYEKVVRENEQLRNRGGDTLLASQWRDRYDALLRERDDVADKLRVLSKTDSLGNRTIEQAFVELKDEYKASCPFFVTLLSFYALLFLPSSSLSHPFTHQPLFHITGIPKANDESRAAATARARGFTVCTGQGLGGRLVAWVWDWCWCRHWQRSRSTSGRRDLVRRRTFPWRGSQQQFWWRACPQCFGASQRGQAPIHSPHALAIP